MDALKKGRIRRVRYWKRRVIGDIVFSFGGTIACAVWRSNPDVNEADEQFARLSLYGKRESDSIDVGCEIDLKDQSFSFSGIDEQRLDCRREVSATSG